MSARAERAPRRVGLTGGIASGKSTVSAILSELGAVVIDSDRLAREVVAPGSPGLAQVVEAFGPEVLTADGEMDRPKVGSIVFADPEKRRVLESIIWPLVARRSEELVAEGGPEALVVHDIPLLVESGQQDGFDAIVVVDAPHDIQLERMVRDRGMSIEDAEARIAAQASREARLEAAAGERGYVIENTGSLEDLRRRVVEVFTQLTA